MKLPLLLVALVCAQTFVAAQEAQHAATPLPEVSETAKTNTETETVISIIEERSDSLLGKADAASEGIVGPKQLNRRPILRPGELLETVPGLIITQHSGSGKANQYFLRGFNLDHGTDLAVSLDGMPLNFPTHGHGQGYIDLNFLIPELVAAVRYRKGGYEADQGDFASAGSVDISYARSLGAEYGIPQTQSIDVGNFGRRRILTTGSPNQNFTYGVEYTSYDGPWKLPEDLRKLNAVLKYNQGDSKQGLTITGMAFDSKWNSTDQVPRRAIASGLIDRFGNIDPTDGGNTHRYSLSSQLWRGNTNLSAYAVDYKLNLFSNFTYFLDDPVRGDQFEQADKRRTYGFHLKHNFGSGKSQNTIGLQGRFDDIKNVGLYLTEARERFDTVRADRVKESSIAPYLQNETRWTDKFRTTLGARFDSYRFDVDSSIAENSGKHSDSIFSPKLALAYKSSADSELYASIGRGFHSNDARGTTINIDPKTGDPADRVTPLVRTNFAELGVRRVKNNLQSTVALWGLRSNSELLFVGDAGTTEASRPSQRIGIEFANYWTPKPNLSFDADFALSKARFRDAAPEGKRIPGAIEGIISLGAAYDPPQGLGGALRLRYFGPRPLIEDNSVRSSSSTLVNGRIGYKFKKGVRLSLEAFNLLNSRVSDIDYYYESQLAGEASPVADIHTHPAEKRSFRLALSRQF
jgi:outer membrane receptor protein involved in Fe transport